MEVLKTIPLRRSIRRYSSENVDEEELKQIIQASSDFIKIFDEEVRFLLSEGSSATKKMFTNAFKDYGKLLNAPYYIGLATKKKYKDNLTNVGFMGEQLVIALTEKGYSTSWLATRNYHAFRKMFDLKENEILPAIISVGHPALDMQSKMINKIMSKSSGKRKKIKKIVYKDSFKTSADKNFLNSLELNDVFEMARLAPSWHNIQPWSFLVKDKKIYLVLVFDQKKYKKRAIDERMHYHAIDMGIIMSHISMCLKEKNIKGEWKIVPKNKTKTLAGELNMKSKHGIPFAVLSLEN